MRYGKCDNTTCNKPNKEQKIAIVVLKTEFNNDISHWCLRCIEKNKWMIDTVHYDFKNWCCWQLDEEEIKLVADKLTTKGNIYNSMSNDTIKQIAENFKKKIQLIVGDWQDLLQNSILEIIGKKPKI